MVSAASRMSSAISFGVFWRFAPSTIEIMRSRNVSPGLAVMRTMSQSDSTRVPPVTRAAVAAALANHGRALAGDRRSRRRRRRRRRCRRRRDDRRPPRRARGRPCRRLDATSVGAASRSGLGRGAPASTSRRACGACPPAPCRGPRPWPRRSWRTSTVEPGQGGDGEDEPGRASPSRSTGELRANRAVVSALPARTTNITGLRTWWRGSSLRNAATIAGLRIAGSRAASPRVFFPSTSRDGWRDLGAATARGEHAEQCARSAWGSTRRWDELHGHRVISGARRSARGRAPGRR